jgi:ubiquinone biosynthesis protein UbiJ
MVTERIQALLDRNIAGSPRARQLLTQLEGRQLRVTVRLTPWHVNALVHAGRLELSRAAPRSADAELSGSPLGLLALVREDPEVVIRRGDVLLTGDGSTAGLFQELALLLRPDLEAELARVIGDIPAHGVGRLLRGALAYGRSSLTTGAQNVGEYLTHEKELLVPLAQARPFLEGVDGLREATDRLAARVTSLEALRKTP